MRQFLILILLILSVSCEGDNPIVITEPVKKSVSDYCALGASTATMSWQKEVAKNLNTQEYTNYAIGGTRWAHTAISAYDLSVNASDNAHNKIMTNQLARLLKDKEDFGYNPEIITIMCGLNDAANGSRIIGNFEHTNSFELTKISPKDWITVVRFKNIRETVYGSTRYFLEQLIFHFPNSKIIIINLQQVDNGTYNNENASNINAVLEHLSIFYECYYIDVFNESGITITSNIPSPFHRPDRLHPNAEGERLLTILVTRKLKEYLNF